MEASDGCYKIGRGFVIGLGALLALPVSGFGFCWFLSTFVFRPELQTMPDQYGVVHDPMFTAIVSLALAIIPLIFMFVMISSIKNSEER